MRPGERQPTPQELAKYTFSPGEVRAIDATQEFPRGATLMRMNRDRVNLESLRDKR